MKKFNFHLLSILILLLAACGNTENSSTEENTSELTELEEENEELREQLQEQDSEEVHEGVRIEESDDGAETIDATEGSEKNNDQNDTKFSDDYKYYCSTRRDASRKTHDPTYIQRR